MFSQNNQPNDYISAFLSDFFGELRPKAEPVQPKACPRCGATAYDLSRTGKVGCAACYETFSTMLLPYIRRIHGQAVHTGKVPVSAGIEIKIRREIAGLKDSLNAAIDKQEFEKAAELRDRIRTLESEANIHE